MANGLEADHVVVAGNGSLYVAPEGTALPVDLAAPASPFSNVGYISDDGVTFTLSRDTEDIMAWQSVDSVRRLVTAEPKELSFALLEFDPASVELAFRGGTVTKTGTAPNEIATYTPPDAGTASVVALVLDWNDGDADWRFVASRAEVSGDVEFQLVRTDAIRLPLVLAILAALGGGPAWKIISDAPSWSAGAVTAAQSGGTPAST